MKTAMAFVKDGNKSRYLAFDTLGQFWYNIGIYKVLFNPAYRLRLYQDGTLEATDERFTNDKFLARRESEIDFHLHFWQMMSRGKVPMVDSEAVVELAMILFNLGSDALEDVGARVERMTYIIS